MLRIILLLSFALVSCSPRLGEVRKTNDAKIMGGFEVAEDATIARSVVGIYDSSPNGGGICTGTLIAPNIVLTAAHCLSDKPSYMKIVFGNHIYEYTNAHEQDVIQEHLRTVVAMKAHPRYGSPEVENQTIDTGDIAILRYSGTTPEGYEPAVFLPVASILQVGVPVVVAGYGVDSVTKTEVNPKFVTQDQLENGDVICDDLMRFCEKIEMGGGDGPLRQTSAKIKFLTETEIVLDESEGKGTCGGDSGGPAFISSQGRFYLFGVTSRGSPACDDEGTYTDALFYYDWIVETVQSLNMKR